MVTQSCFGIDKEANMKTYRVLAKSISYVYVDIEAESPEKAKEAAESLDGGDFVEDGGAWEFDSDDPYEVDEEPMFKYNDVLYP